MKKWHTLLFILILSITACKKEAPKVTANEVRAAFQETLPAKPDDPAWKNAPVHPGKLILQDMVEPRLMTPSTLLVKAQAIHDGKTLAFRLQWEDASANELPGPGRFADACAVQLPATVEADVPAPQMGDPGKQVEISYWSAVWQASVDGRLEGIRSIYPNAAVDHYPFQAPSLKKDSPEQRAMERRYAPAFAIGNTMAGAKKNPVQDLIAEGPGTLSVAPRMISRGKGERTEKGWSVVILRPLPESMAAVSRSQVAFAVWEGSKQEVGSRKMRTAWIPITLEGAKK